MSDEVLLHLLKPREFRVWCRPKVIPGNFGITGVPSKCTCANCLTAFRAHTQGNRKPYRVKHIPTRELSRG